MTQPQPLDRPCSQWSLQVSHETHTFFHADGHATCPGWGQPAQPLDLDTIQAALAERPRTGKTIANGHIYADRLLARVRELELQLAATRAELERERAGKGHINLTRACTGCGHSRITHTAPEPHSCFAESCGCPTFADPLDPSVAHDAR